MRGLLNVPKIHIQIHVKLNADTLLSRLRHSRQLVPRSLTFNIWFELLSVGASCFDKQ